MHDWCYLELADLEGEESNHHSQVLWTRGLLIRRNIANGDLAYFTTWCPAGTSIKTLVSVEGHRWAIEDSFETAKNKFGLDHNESRSWHGWHRHVSLVMLGFAMMAAIQHQANKPTPKKPSRAQRQDIRSHSLVDPGNPPHSSTSRAKTHSTRRCHRMVALAARSSGRSTEISSQTKITTVMSRPWPPPKRWLRWRLRNLLAMEPGFGPLDQRLLLTGAAPRFILAIDVGERLPVGVEHEEAGGSGI